MALRVIAKMVPLEGENMDFSPLNENLGGEFSRATTKLQVFVKLVGRLLFKQVRKCRKTGRSAVLIVACLFY